MLANKKKWRKNKKNHNLLSKSLTTSRSCSIRRLNLAQRTRLMLSPLTRLILFAKNITMRTHWEMSQRRQAILSVCWTKRYRVGIGQRERTFHNYIKQLKPNSIIPQQCEQGKPLLNSSSKYRRELWNRVKKIYIRNRKGKEIKVVMPVNRFQYWKRIERRVFIRTKEKAKEGLAQKISYRETERWEINHLQNYKDKNTEKE